MFRLGRGLSWVEDVLECHRLKGNFCHERELETKKEIRLTIGRSETVDKETFHQPLPYVWGYSSRGNRPLPHFP